MRRALYIAGLLVAYAAIEVVERAIRVVWPDKEPG